jgi:pimeloyl-ACP methyl ester carboxylesterase
MQAQTITLEDGATIAYRELGEGPPVLLIHGWPTSSLLWRNVMPAIARANRVIAIDLPGFGASDKPVDAPYDLPYFQAAVDGLLDALELDRVGVAGHDLGGPVAVHHAIHRPERTTSLALLNTLVYPEIYDTAEMENFMAACTKPELRDQLTAPDGLAFAMRLGVADESKLTDEAIAGVQAPFAERDARLALAAAGIGVDRVDFAGLAERLGELTVPIRVVYGAQDRILPDMPATFARLQAQLPQTEVTDLPEAGHFCQEEEPEAIGELLAAFFAANAGYERPPLATNASNQAATRR